jgi:hypothetical protein
MRALIRVGNDNIFHVWKRLPGHISAVFAQFVYCNTKPKCYRMHTIELIQDYILITFVSIVVYSQSLYVCLFADAACGSDTLTASRKWRTASRGVLFSQKTEYYIFHLRILFLTNEWNFLPTLFFLLESSILQTTTSNPKYSANSANRNNTRASIVAIPRSNLRQIDLNC